MHEMRPTATSVMPWHGVCQSATCLYLAKMAEWIQDLLGRRHLEATVFSLWQRGGAMGENFAHCVTQKQLAKSRSCLCWRHLGT